MQTLLRSFVAGGLAAVLFAACTSPGQTTSEPGTNGMPPELEAGDLGMTSAAAVAGKTGQRLAFSQAYGGAPVWNTENYAQIEENGFRMVTEHPLSTFSIDVDAASYSNVRRFIDSGQRPPKDAVRIEEMINYFAYDYPDPQGEAPFSTVMEIGRAPWNANHQLVHVGIKGGTLDLVGRPATNLVFLLDVSGSMSSPDKLPLLKKAFSMLVRELDENDRVSIVVYAGAAGLVLPPTSGDQKGTILEALGRLEAGGSTAGAAGIQLAYQTAGEQFIQGGINRVILATDGDFNVGVSSDAELVRMIESRREEGTFLTVLGFGTGNLKDSRMEQVANHGNGNYYYIDGELEARKVLVNELGGTLHTIAKDVKLQVEFNPAVVASYRLIGYENRLLASEDFNDDEKDAGELGAGHTVTALYEVVPVGVEASSGPAVDDLRYQTPQLTGLAQSGEMLTLKLRYKEPEAEESLLQTHHLTPDPTLSPSRDFVFSAAVAAFGMILRDSEHRGATDVAQVLKLARLGQGEDLHGYRGDFVRMVERYREKNESWTQGPADD
ncbi:MAG: VWA domain-containing protein [Rhodothermales bacterium]|nr:VWA domain-containing protein [Rhodothermales bacterium]